MRILIADDERGIRMTLEDDLVDAGFDVTAVADGEAAWAEMQSKPFDMMVSDIVMPKMDGLDLLEKVKGEYPDTFTVMITGNSSDQRSRRAIDLGVNYYLEKPFSNEQVVMLAREAAQKLELARTLKERDEAESLVGSSKAMAHVIDQVKTVAGSEFAVLVTGPSGSGKERVAKMLHMMSPRAGKDFVVVHCGMYAETLMEDELFGHEAGAYTGATSSREGRFERAAGGTIFLDDIDDMPLATQVKLLRVLQEGEIERLGGSSTIKIDVRVIASTKVDLAKLVSEGKFREDLYYRLNVIPLILPPLADREGDVALLVHHFLKVHGGGRHYTIDVDEMSILEAHDWPGNVRELENSVKRAIALAGASDAVLSSHMITSQPKRAPMLPSELQPTLEEARPLRMVVESVEERYILEILKLTKFSKKDAAEILGISRKNLWEKLKKYEIED